MAESLTDFEFILYKLDAFAALDILIVALFIYLALVFFKETQSLFIFSTIVLLTGVAYLSRLFELRVTQALLQPFLTFFLLIIVVVFQREIRRFFEWFSLGSHWLTRTRHSAASERVTDQVVEAVSELVSKRMGAIIVFEGAHPLVHSIERAVLLNGEVSASLLLSIFDPTSPGHDGAVIIRGDKITHFGAHLPLVQKYTNLDKGGTRHRAAAGITEETDSLAIVVSEERGIVSIARNGLLRKISKDECKAKIENYLQTRTKAGSNKNFLVYLVARNVALKALAVALAIALWFLFTF